MAKSTAEQVRELASDLRAADITSAYTEREVLRIRETTEVLKVDLSSLRQENAVLRQRLDDHTKRYELWEARRWAFVMALVGAVLSLASGLIVTLARTTPR